MKKYFYDLHIHTALSPCADILMSPNNILNMAMLKNLNIIAITDHNSCLQLEAVEKLKDSYEMIIIPGVEVEVKEKYHVLCLFKSFEYCKKFQIIINNYINNLIHDETIYGEQTLFDSYDDIVGKYQISLMGSLNINLQELRIVINELEGLMILAHIEKYSTDIFDKILDAYCDIFDAIEVNSNYDLNKIANKLNKISCMILRNSDAHQIIDISEPINTIELEAFSIDSLFKKIRGGSSNG